MISNDDPGYEVGVRALKAQLSAHLRRVAAGERLTVTDHGRPIALLIPVDAAPVPDWLDALLSDGVARWSGGKPAGLERKVPSRGKPASTMVLEDRR